MGSNKKQPLYCQFNSFLFQNKFVKKFFNSCMEIIFSLRDQAILNETFL